MIRSINAASMIAETENGLDMLPTLGDTDTAVVRMHDYMLHAKVMQLQGRDADAAACEQRAFETLRDVIVEPVMATPVEPRCAVVSDQIVWGRSPARLDLAGGWTDTPPYAAII